MQLYCLDNSDASCRSEDYPCGNRLAWQLKVIQTISRSLLAPVDGQDLDGAAVSRSKRSLAVVASAGRPALSVAPTNDAAALLGLDLACHDSERSQFLGGLRLALLAAKRSVDARVLAFLASQADLPIDQCRQLSSSFSTAGVPLDVVLLCPHDELQAGDLTALELLTAVSVYEKQPNSASTGKQTAQRSRLSEQQQRSGVGSATSSGAGAAEPSGLATLAAGPPAGQRLVRFPPPDPSQALWQNLELLLEQLQLDRPAQQGGQLGSDPGAGTEDERPATPATRLQSNPAVSGRPPLPRPGRQRGLPGAAASSVPLAAASSAAAAAAQTLRSGLVASGPLPSRSAARRGITSGNCRYESLDSLQHLSLDGFLRSWLPSYANVSRVMPIPTQQQPQLQRQSPDGSGGTGEVGGGALAEVSAGGGGPARLCYISIYRLQLPQWHKLLEVKAGCMYELQLPPGATPGGLHGEESSTPSPGSGVGQAVGPPDKYAEGGGTAATAIASTGTGSGTKMPALPPPSRPIVARAPCPVPISFSTRCSSAAAATAAVCIDHNISLPSHWVCPDLRRGCLSLIASVEDPGVVKLLWSERQRANPEAAQHYGNIFAAAEDSLGDGGVDPAAAELELTLSPTQSQFRVVPNVRGGAVLEVIAPRTAIHRRRTEGGAPGVLSGSSSVGHPSEAVGPASSPPSSDTTARSGASGGASPRIGRDSIAPWSSQQSLLHHHTQHPQQRYFFWLQQEWPAGAVDTADEVLGATGSGCPLASPAASGASRRWDCVGLVDQLQALLECPPEFDPHKHGGRVRCSSTPLQLGPLPFALVEEIMRASGRHLSPDGTITHLARSAASPSTTLAAAASTAVMNFAAQQQQRAGPSRPRARAIPTIGGASSASNGGAADGPRTEAATATTAADAAVGALKRAAGGPETAPDRLPPHTLQTSGNAVRGAITDSSATPYSQTPDRRDVVSGFRRVTYSKVVLPQPRLPPGAARGPDRTGDEPAGAMEAPGTSILTSHPLEELEWGSESDDSDSQAAGSSHVGSTSETPQPSSPRASGLGPTQAVPADADTSPSNGCGIETVPTPRPSCLAGECGRSGFAAAAAAATAGTSSAPLVAAAVEPDGGGSCQEESSLMFELD